MSFNMQRRPSSWFGPQFNLASFSSYTSGSFSSPRGSYSRGSTSEPRRSSNLKPSMPVGKLPMPEPMPEPLFHDSYLTGPSDDEDDLSPTTPDPKFSCLWGQATYKPEFFVTEEKVEELDLETLDIDESNVVATYISILNLGKPKVVEIPAQALSRQQSPRYKSERTTRPAIVWRMPSYDLSPPSRSSNASYSGSERTESFDSHSTYESSVSEGPKTPSLYGEQFPKVPDFSRAESPNYRELPSRGSLSRSSTTLLRRSSRNLSASFSKTFFSRLKDAEVSQPPPSLFAHPYTPEPAVNASVNFSLPYSTTKRPQTSQSHYTQDAPQMSPKPQYLTSVSKQSPALRRKKSIAGIWF